MHEVVARSGKKDEFTFWKSQIVTPKADKKGLRRNPYALLLALIVQVVC